MYKVDKIRNLEIMVENNSKFYDVFIMYKISSINNNNW